MAQRPVHRLNLYLVPDEPERSIDEAALAAALAALRGEGALEGWRPGPRREALVEGGFALLRVDRPPGPALYGNRQGGYRALCPSCGANLVPAVLPALLAWRAGGDRSLRCAVCGEDTRLESVDYRPIAAPGRFALELRDVGTPRLAADARPALARALGGGFVVVGSRG
jgi:hypothetical protein